MPQTYTNLSDPGGGIGATSNTKLQKWLSAVKRVQRYSDKVHTAAHQIIGIHCTSEMTDTTSVASSEGTGVKKPVKEIPVVHDMGFFQHDTGDTYDGYFEAKKKDRVAKMHGPGTYITAEGDTYTGAWETDKLGANEDVTILYKDGAMYEGSFRDWSYQGRGRYYYPDGSILKCDFSESAPIGPLHLIDPNGHVWLGKADQGFGWLKPVNHFYDLLETTRDSVKTKKRNKTKKQ